MGGVEVALEVDADDRVPLVLGHREDHPVAQDARVVDEDVQLAERGDRQLDQFPGLFVVGHVTDVGDRAAARRADLVGDLLGGAGRRLAGTVPARLAVVVDDDGRAEPGEFQRLGPAEPAARAGDDRGQALQVAVTSEPFQSSRAIARWSDLDAGTQRLTRTHLVQRVVDLARAAPGG